VKLFHLVRKEFIELFRQKELLPMMLIAPIVQVIVLGYVVSTDVDRVPVYLVNRSQSVEARRLVQRISSTPLFDVRHSGTGMVNTLEVLRGGKAMAVVEFRDSGDGGSTFPEILISLDGVDANTSAIAAGYLNGILRRFLEEEARKHGRAPPVSHNTLIRYNPSLRSINYMGPGIVALLLTILTLFMTSISLVREKEQQTMDTLMVSQLRPWQIYLGKALPMAFIGLVEMSLGTLLVMLWFRVPVRGNLLYLFLAAVVFLAAILAYALLISTIAGTQQQALFFSWFSMVTFIMLSGLFTPVENIPSWLRFLADINPVRYLIGIIREIFLKGNGIAFFSGDLLRLGVIAAVVITISLLSFRRFISK